MIGETIAHYRVLRELGRGGMGIVYLAEDTRLGRQVAIKALPVDLASDVGRRKRFEQEARAAAALNHPNIASVYGLETERDSLYIVFEYVEGESVRAVAQRGALAADSLTSMADALADALAAAHARGIVHRDLKPENVILTASSSPKILDFGLARMTAASPDALTASLALTQAGTLMGTVAYMSPEQLNGKDADSRSDIFSLGVMLYELASGRHPFQGESPASTIAHVLTREPDSLAAGNPLTPPELDRIIRKCLRKNREERYQSALDLKVDLQSLARGGGAPVAQADRRWWWVHHLATMFVITPLVIWYILQTRSAMPTSLRPYLLFLEVFAIALNWCLRFVLITTGMANPAMLKEQAIRLVPWLWWSGWAIVSGLVAIALTIAGTNEMLAAIMATWAMGGVVSVVLLEPSTRRSAFGD